MQVAAVTYKNIAELGFAFNDDPSKIRSALSRLDLDGKVAATYVDRGFDYVARELLTPKNGFRGFGNPVVIIVVSDGQSHVEQGASESGMDALQRVLQPFERGNVFRVVLDIFEGGNANLLDALAGADGAVLPLHCKAQGMLQARCVTNEATEATVESASSMIVDHIRGLSDCRDSTTTTTTTTMATTTTTTATATATTTTTTTSTDPCLPYADVVFVIDTSTSMVDDEFCLTPRGINRDSTFVELVSFALTSLHFLKSDVDAGWVRVGAVVFSTASEMSFGLQSGATAAEIKSLLVGIKPPAKYNAFGMRLETASNMHLGLREAQKVLEAGGAAGHPERAQHIVVLSDFIPRNKQRGQPCSKSNPYAYENCIMQKGVAALEEELTNNIFFKDSHVKRWAFDVGCTSILNSTANTVAGQVIKMVSPATTRRGKVADVAAARGFAEGGLLSTRICTTSTSTTSSTTTPSTVSTATTTSTSTSSSSSTATLSSTSTSFSSSTVTTTTTTTTTATSTTTTTCMRPDADVVFMIDASSSVVDLRFKGCGAFTKPINEFTNHIIDRFDKDGYFTGGDDGMHVAAVTYKNIGNIGFSFQNDANSIKQSLNNLDLGGKVAATYAHRGFEVIGQHLLNSNKYGFRGFGVPVIIVIISDGKSHFEDFAGQSGANLLEAALSHPNINRKDVFRVVLEIFDSENKGLYNKMASSPEDVLPLHCDVGGVVANTVSADGLGGPLDVGLLEILISDTILDAAAGRILDHVRSLTDCTPTSTTTTTSSTTSTRTTTRSVTTTSTSSSTSTTEDPCKPWADVVFVIDQSTSIIDDEFCDGRTAATYEVLTEFAAEVTQALAPSIDAGWVRVGAVAFATSSSTAVGLRSSHSAAAVGNKLRNLKLPSGSSSFGLIRETTSNLHLGLQKAETVFNTGSTGAHPDRAMHVVILSDFIPRNKKHGTPCPINLGKDNFYKYESCIMQKGVTALQEELDSNAFYKNANVQRWSFDVGCKSASNVNANSVSRQVIPMVSPLVHHRMQLNRTAVLAFAASVTGNRICPTTTTITTTITTTTPTSTTSTTTTTTTWTSTSTKTTATTTITTTTTSTTSTTTTTATSTTTTTATTTTTTTTFTTTTITSVTTRTTTTCSNVAAADVVLLLDVSTSVSTSFSGPCEKETVVKHFLNNMVDSFGALGLLKDDGSLVRMSTVTYSNVANVAFGFESNKQTIKKKIDQIGFAGDPGTFMHKGMDKVSEILLNNKYGFRNYSVPVILLVVTDGRSLLPEEDIGALARSIGNPATNQRNLYRFTALIGDSMLNTKNPVITLLMSRNNLDGVPNPILLPLACALLEEDSLEVQSAALVAKKWSAQLASVLAARLPCHPTQTTREYCSGVYDPVECSVATVRSCSDATALSLDIAATTRKYCPNMCGTCPSRQGYVCKQDTMCKLCTKHGTSGTAHLKNSNTTYAYVVVDLVCSSNAQMYCGECPQYHS